MSPQYLSGAQVELERAAGIELRPYQTEARDRVLAELEGVRATLLVLATGLGKTVCFAAVAAVYVALGRRVLVLAHRGELLDQAAATLARFGLTVGIEQADRRAGDAQVVIASVQTMRGKRLESFAPDGFGLVVIDEAHHTAAKTYRAVLAHFEPAKVLGVTATPDRADGVGLRHAFESEAFRMELGAGISGGWLAPIDLRSVVVEHLDLSHVGIERGDFVAADLERELTRERVLHEVAAPLAELAGDRRTLAFVAGVKQAYALARVLREHGVKAAAVDGGMSREARAQVLADYRAGRVQVVCNAMLLTEGYDTPETSCIALVRPTRARGLLVQMIGRGTRCAEGKTSCLILDFVPGRTGAVRLAAPADALAGAELPSPLLARVRAISSAEAGELGALIQQAREDLEAERLGALRRHHAEELERARLIRSGLKYAAARVDIGDLLRAVRLPEPGVANDTVPEWKRKPATTSQLGALRKAGFEVPCNITRADADALFDVLAERRREGLCSVRQAKLLRRYGLRDDVCFNDAREALDAIAANAWKPPLWLYRDARFQRPSEQVA
jgi:superfamily II DNA or RNA helicase